MGEVVIRLDGRTLERLLYWIVIIILFVWLAFSYFGDSGTEAQETTTETTNTVEVIQPEEQTPPENTVSAIDETCSDDIKNQDEVGIDCGGVCTTINGEYWYDGSCHDDPEPEKSSLSGDIDFEVSNVKTEENEDSGAIKVVSFQVKITNGEERKFFPTVMAHAKDGSVYLGHLDGSYDEDDGDSPYMGPFELDGIDSGESLTLTLGGGSEGGSYPWTTVGSYDPGDEFSLVIELYDDSGEKVDQITRTVR